MMWTFILFLYSGSSVNTVTRKILNIIPYTKIENTSKNIEIILLNKSKITSNLQVELEIVFNERKVKAMFLVLEDGITDIIIG